MGWDQAPCSHLLWIYSSTSKDWLHFSRFVRTRRYPYSMLDMVKDRPIENKYRKDQVVSIEIESLLAIVTTNTTIVLHLCHILKSVFWVRSLSAIRNGKGGVSKRYQLSHFTVNKQAYSKLFGSFSSKTCLFYFESKYQPLLPLTCCLNYNLYIL